ncbi:hypothetical protein ECAE60S_03898 [Eoetvoesiella caeni]
MCMISFSFYVVSQLRLVREIALDAAQKCFCAQLNGGGRK